MTYSQYDLKKLQRVQLHILLELKRICDKHDIHYFLLGGTLIGAIRHHGFIPWDDGYRCSITNGYVVRSKYDVEHVFSRYVSFHYFARGCEIWK